MDLDLICPICGEKKYCIPYDKQVVYCTNCNGKKGSIYFLRGADITQDLLNKTDIYIFYHPLKEFVRYFLGDNEAFEIASKEWKYLVQILPEQVEAWYPRTFAQKIDYMLQYFADHMKYDGEFVSYSVEELKNILFIKESKFNSENLDDIIRQVRYILSYLIKIDYIETNLLDNQGICALRYMSTCNDSQFISLTPKGLARVDELQKDISSNKDIFVAMAFNDNTVPTREAIREGIKEAHFSEKFLDEIIHNQQIVPYMMRLIRECRFLIMDITDPNYGAYYEAGYALGLGKEVIITCSKEIFSKKDFANKLEEKALKPHFDIAQKQILVWEDTADLTKQLKEWILELSTRKR